MQRVACLEKIVVITILRRFVGIPLALEQWFCPHVNVFLAILPVKYIQCTDSRDHILFSKSEFFTLLLDLNIAVDEILSKLPKNAIYEIRRAEREGVTYESSNDWRFFHLFYNNFAKAKALQPLSYSSLADRKDNLMLFVSWDAMKDPIAMHVYVVDNQSRRARLLYSASRLHSTTEKSLRAFIGRANRYLHWQEVLYFKNLRFKIIDFGGYSLDARQQQLDGVNGFKASFGGQIVCEPMFVSWPLFAVQLIVSRIRRGTLR
jgi:hypothetical protein